MCCANEFFTVVVACATVFQNRTYFNTVDVKLNVATSFDSCFFKQTNVLAVKNVFQNAWDHVIAVTTTTCLAAVFARSITLRLTHLRTNKVFLVTPTARLLNLLKTTHTEHQKEEAHKSMIVCESVTTNQSCGNHA